MKKTLIALAVAASAVVSGSAMAWTANGVGGSVELGGVLTPDAKETPWEVKVGDAVKDLDAKFNKGQKTVDITVKDAIPLLGIRTQSKTAFKGQMGISPQISYGDMVKTDSFSKGYAPLILDVKDSTGAKLGTAETSILATALASYIDNDGHNVSSLYATQSGKGFFGGVGKNADAVVDNPYVVASGFFKEAVENYTNQGLHDRVKPGQTTFAIPDGSYSAFYASGIEKNQTIKLTLDKDVRDDAPVQWTASLPITVSYM